MHLLYNKQHDIPFDVIATLTDSCRLQGQLLSAQRVIPKVKRPRGCPVARQRLMKVQDCQRSKNDAFILSTVRYVPRFA
jgi:hypothetical protein